jgi:hypothetical protein
LPLAAEGCHQQGLSDRVLSPETVRQAIRRLGLGWKRAKQWLTSPDPAYGRKKSPGALVALSRSSPRLGALALPMRPGGADWPARSCTPGAVRKGPLRLQHLQAEKDDPDPKALCCYGLLRADTETMLLRFVQGRPGEPSHRSLPGLALRAAGR